MCLSLLHNTHTHAHLYTKNDFCETKIEHMWKQWNTVFVNYKLAISFILWSDSILYFDLRTLFLLIVDIFFVLWVNVKINVIKIVFNTMVQKIYNLFFVVYVVLLYHQNREYIRAHFRSFIFNRLELCTLC
jgi:hypothetical protein